MSSLGRVFLFDIDGTLIRGDGAGRRAMNAAFDAVLGAPGAMDGIRFDGATDRALVREGLAASQASRLAGLAAADVERLVDEVLERYLVALDAELAERQPFRALPGAAELARALAAHGQVGLGTGNVEAAAWRKVTAVGMGDLFGFGGFGSDAEVRADVLAIGAERGAARAGLPRAHCEVIVIGDTERDIAAARAIGARVIAVATGGTPLDVLERAEPDALLDSLTDVARACGLITARI